MLESIENLEDTKGKSIKDWVMMAAPRNEIKNRFKSFLRTYTDSNGSCLYRERIKHMCESNQVNLSINLSEKCIRTLAYSIAYNH